MRTSLTSKLIAGSAALLGVLAAQWFDPAPATAADRETRPSAKIGEPGAQAPAAEARTTRYPIRGKLKAVNPAARTFTLSGVDKERVFKTTPQTEITRAGKPATLADAVVGDEVGGLVERQTDGSVVALKVRFGPKTEEEKNAAKPKRKPRSSAGRTAETP